MSHRHKGKSPVRKAVRRVAGTLLVMAALVAALPGLAWAGASPWSETPEGAVRLVSAGTGAGSDGKLMVGLQFRLEPGWKVYWRSPGDAGLPPEVDWSTSSNVAGAEMLWPAPERFSFSGIETFGYEKEVVLPIRLAVADAASPVMLKPKIAYLTCKEICIQHTADVSLKVAGAGGTPTRFAHLIGRYVSKVPGNERSIGLDVGEGRLVRAGAGLNLSLALRSDMGFTKPDLIVEGPEGFTAGVPTVKLADKSKAVTIRVPIELLPPASKTPEAVYALKLTLLDEGRAAEFERRFEVGTAPLVGSASARAPSLAIIFLLALIGGLILNVMPCVLPVLSLKLIHFASLGGKEAARIRASFVATSAGIVATFMALAGLLAGLKAAGHAIGWGMQFQQPVFIAVLAVIVTVFACNLLGLFEIRLPGWVGRVEARRPDQESIVGDFATGILVTVLATPCTAPFLGTSVGFALSQDTATIIAVFAALGLGMALPYLAVAAFPQVERLLPRPGPWMVRVKQILGLALVATAAWLVWLAAAQLGTTIAGVITAFLLLLTGILFVAGRAGEGRRKGWQALAGAVAVLAIAAPLAVPGNAGIDVADETSGPWVRFDRARIATLVAAGKTVFVDVTAKWCITCQVNKAVVLETDEVASRLKGANVVAMVADWTNPDDEIAAYLASYSRYGIPFNVIYGPGAPNGVVLPELLSRTSVLNGFRQARAGALAADESDK